MIIDADTHISPTGEDTMFELMHVEVAKCHALLHGEVTPEEKALIMAGNIAGLLGYETGQVV